MLPCPRNSQLRQLTSVRQRRNRTAQPTPGRWAFPAHAVNGLLCALTNCDWLHAGRWTVLPDATYQFEDFGLELRWAAASMRGNTGSNDVKPNQDAASCMVPLGPYASTAFFGIFDGHGDGGEKPAAYAAQRVSAPICTSPLAPPRADHASHTAVCSILVRAKRIPYPCLLPVRWLPSQLLAWLDMSRVAIIESARLLTSLTLVQVPALLSRSTTLTTNPFFALRDSYITTNSSLHTRSDFSDELCGTTAASIMVSGTTL